MSRDVSQWFRDTFGRRTSDRQFVPQVDGLRFFAIAAVLVRHGAVHYAELPAVVGTLSNPADSLPQQAARGGWIGVQVFFAISGFVLALPFARAALAGGRPVSLRRYYVRRVTRIEPPFVINLLVCASVMLWWWPHPAWYARYVLKRLAVTLAYAHSAVYHELSPVNGVVWSLEVEVQFYLIAPLLMAVFRLRSAAARRGVIAGAIVAFALLRPYLRYHLTGMVQGVTVVHQLPYFLVGFLLADLFLTAWRRPSRFPWAWDIVAALAWVALLAPLPSFEDRYPFVRYTPYPWLDLSSAGLIGLIGAAAFRGRVWRHVVGWWPVYLIGGMCYTIYLYHILFLFPALERTARFHLGHGYTLNLLLHLGFAAAATVAASAVPFLLFEKPFMRPDWPAAVARRLTRREPPAAAIVTQS